MSNTTKPGVVLLSFAHFHQYTWAETFFRDNRIRVVGFWDSDPGRGEAMNLKYNLPFYQDLDELLSRKDVQGAAICSENFRHKELTLRCCEKGIHVFCEKPTALTLTECREMKAAVEKSGVLFLQSFPQRLMSGNLAIKKLLDEGAIGKICHVRKRHGHPFGLKGLEKDMPWIVDPGSAGGGAYLDEGVHQTDLLRWYFGRPLSVMAQTSGTLGHVETSGAAIYRFEGDILAVHEAGWNWHAGGPTTEIYGEKGTIIQSYTDCASNSKGNFCPHLALYLTKTECWEEMPVTYDFSTTHTLFPKMFADLLTGEKTELPATIDDGMKALEMVVAAYRSAQTGQLVTFPLTEEEIS